MTVINTEDKSLFNETEFICNKFKTKWNNVHKEQYKFKTEEMMYTLSPVANVDHTLESINIFSVQFIYV